MGYGNIDALTKPIDILFALVHSTTRLLNLCLFSLQVCIIYFLFHHCCICISIDFWLLRGTGLPNERARLVLPVLFSPLKEAKLILSSHGCCQSCCASGDEPKMFATMWWWHGWDCRVASSQHHHLFFATPTHTGSYQLYGNSCLFILFYLFLSFIFFPHLHFCFVSQFFGDEWHCLTSMHLSLLLPPPPTRWWWYPAFNSSFNSSHGLIQSWLTSQYMERVSF